MIVGEALIKLLEAYQVDTMFGIPGVHTLDLYRGLSSSSIRHVTVRHEQGAGFAADGYARVTGKPGVCLLISGPGLLNAATPIGQAYADSIPMLVISSDNKLSSLGKGFGLLHEVTDLTATTAPITGMSLTVTETEQIPSFLADAFTMFASGRPRPVHLSIPTDILAQPLSEAAYATWKPLGKVEKKSAPADQISAALDFLLAADHPLIIAGGGALDAVSEIQALAEWLPAPVLMTNGGKGILPSAHPLSLNGTTSRPVAQKYISEADLILVVGSELAETDSYIDEYEIAAKIIRVDVDPLQFDRLYPTEIGIEADAQLAMQALLASARQQRDPVDFEGLAENLEQIRQEIRADISATEAKHIAVMQAIQKGLPEEAVAIGDMTQIVYTGTAFWETDTVRKWFYAGGFCTLGCALPMGIGAKLADPSQPVVVMAGDAGFQFTLTELATAVEEKLALPIVIWNNAGLGAIRGHMDEQSVVRMAVDYSGNPDFVALAEAYGCVGVRPQSPAELTQAIEAALTLDRPTLIDVVEEIDWLSPTQNRADYDAAPSPSDLEEAGRGWSG